jgi:hypothetical protein
MDDSKDNFRPSELITSKLRYYSYGIVAANKALSSSEIEVTPMEELTMLDGEITTRSTDYTASGKDSLGKSYKSSVEAQASIKATWLRFGEANRMTAPDVRRGEPVMIYQFGDADKYWWMTLKQDMSLRKLETVVWAFSATQNEKDKTDAEHSYYLEVSTHKGLVHFHTSKANGEPFAYDIQINSKEGSIAIIDDAGNFIAMDSANARLQMVNSSGSSLDIDKANITIKCSDVVDIECGTFKLNATTADITAETAVNGNSSLKGNLDVTGNGSIGGSTTSGGNISTSGNVSATGTVHGSNI